MTRKPLTPKQEAFVREYLIDFNATQAAIRSGYRGKQADVIGTQLLSRTRDIIEEKKRALTQKKELQAEHILQEFIRLGFSNMDDYVEWDADGNVKVKPSADLSRGKKSAIKTIESDSVTTVDQEGNRETRTKFKFQLHAKEGPLTKLGEKYGLFPKANGQATIGNLTVNLQASSDPPEVKALIENLSLEDRKHLLALMRKAQGAKIVGEGKT